MHSNTITNTIFIVGRNKEREKKAYCNNKFLK